LEKYDRQRSEVNIEKIDIRDYNYALPPERIAQYPAAERDLSKLLVYRGNKISNDVFRNIHNYIPENSLMVFNNTRVIRARLLFRKESGALIEIFCLEPLEPSGYEQSFGAMHPVEWKCIVGNLKKWKRGSLSRFFLTGDTQHILTAEKIKAEEDAWRIRFSWDDTALSFAEVMEYAGILPLPPYVNREAEPDDLDRYQTIYSRIDGSVAAPTAGLHFTGETVEKLKAGGTGMAEITLHVGAGTFKPVKTGNILDHRMHTEHFAVTRGTVEILRKYAGKIIAIGTTSVRTLESLYWLGARISKIRMLTDSKLNLGQWEPYEINSDLSASESMEIILDYMKSASMDILRAETDIMIVPGYEFRMTGGMLTNFHQPCSTLLLLISAWTGNYWKEIYDYALKNDFRFLSYGDSSLLIRQHTLY
jgi:S-adenosylmethionine:tRNA ribosyltransferase-isomerase